SDPASYEDIPEQHVPIHGDDHDPTRPPRRPGPTYGKRPPHPRAPGRVGAAKPPSGPPSPDPERPAASGCEFARWGGPAWRPGGEPRAVVGRPGGDALRGAGACEALCEAAAHGLRRTGHHGVQPPLAPPGLPLAHRRAPDPGHRLERPELSRGA